MGRGEAAAYWVVRTGLAVAGLLAICGTVICHFLSPQLYYDHLPEPPPLLEQLPSIAIEVAFGTLLLLPHRLTMRPWLFWTRLAASVAGGLVVAWAGVDGIIDGLRGGRDPAIFPASIAFIIVGLSMPGCLWWCARRTNRCSGLAIESVRVASPEVASR